jgi:hypothetical protein
MVDATLCAFNQSEFPRPLERFIKTFQGASRGVVYELAGFTLDASARYRSMV